MHYTIALFENIERYYHFHVCYMGPNRDTSNPCWEGTQLQVWS